MVGVWARRAGWTVSVAAFAVIGAGAAAFAQTDATTILDPPEGMRQIETCLGQATAGWEEEVGCIGGVTKACIENDPIESPAVTANCYKYELELWNARMDETDERISAAHRADPAGRTQKFAAWQQSQQDWAAWRDSECAHQASIRPGAASLVSAFNCQLVLTGRRAIDLAVLLRDIEPQ